MQDVKDWPRVRLTVAPSAPEFTLEQTEEALYLFCSELWGQKKIPVVAWGCEFDGVELHPPIKH
ncbi:MAG: hypothetical protein OXC68_06590 [Aestuariivita sp.]|nr:hypothetical protein [Aestuariivita sp.]